MTRFPDIALSVLIPSYNEERNIETAIPRIVERLREMVGRFEVIIIDDHSTDSTPQKAARLASAYPEVQVVRNEVNLRQGGSLAKGFLLARYDLVTHNAMDCAFDYADLPQVLSHFPGADVVVARRRTYPGVSETRRLASVVNRVLLRSLFRSPVHDYNFIQVYTRSFLREHVGFSTATPFITAEKILRALHAGLRVVEVEVDYHPRLHGTPSSANWKNIRAALRDMFRLWIELKVRS